MTPLTKLEERINTYFEINDKNLDITYENTKKIETKVNLTFKYAEELDKELCELREEVKQLTQRKERFQHNLMYIEVIEEIITNVGTEWEGKQFTNMLVRIAGRTDEVYKIFVSVANAPSVGDSVNFIFNADDNKLSKLRIIKPNE